MPDLPNKLALVSKEQKRARKLVFAAIFALAVLVTCWLFI